MKAKALWSYAKNVVKKLCENETLSKHNSSFDDEEKKAGCRALLHGWSAQLAEILVKRKSSNLKQVVTKFCGLLNPKMSNVDREEAIGTTGACFNVKTIDGSVN